MMETKARQAIRFLSDEECIKYMNEMAIKDECKSVLSCVEDTSADVKQDVSTSHDTDNTELYNYNDNNWMDEYHSSSINNTNTSETIAISNPGNQPIVTTDAPTVYVNDIKDFGKKIADKTENECIKTISEFTELGIDYDQYKRIIIYRVVNSMRSKPFILVDDTHLRLTEYYAKGNYYYPALYRFLWDDGECLFMCYNLDDNALMKVLIDSGIRLHIRERRRNQDKALLSYFIKTKCKKETIPLCTGWNEQQGKWTFISPLDHGKTYLGLLQEVGYEHI